MPVQRKATHRVFFFSMLNLRVFGIFLVMRLSAAQNVPPGAGDRVRGQPPPMGVQNNGGARPPPPVDTAAPPPQQINALTHLVLANDGPGKVASSRVPETLYNLKAPFVKEDNTRWEISGGTCAACNNTQRTVTLDPLFPV